MVAVAGDVMVHLKQGSDTQGGVATAQPKTALGSGTGGTEVAPDMKRRAWTWR